MSMTRGKQGYHCQRSEATLKTRCVLTVHETQVGIWPCFPRLASCRLIPQNPCKGRVSLAGETVKNLFLFLSLLLSSVTALCVWAEEFVQIEDWSESEVGARGIPPGWTGQTWGHPQYDLTIVLDERRKALHLKSKNDSSTINKKIEHHVNLQNTPILQWQWKVVALPRGGDSRRKETLDQAAQLYISWPRFPRAFRSRIIGYVWDTTAPVGTVVKSQKMHMVTYIIVRSGDAEVGQWLTERRNVWDDYQVVFGEEPKDLGYLSLSIDTNDTHSYAEAFIGSIFFVKP
jgi:hypothetical protein